MLGSKALSLPSPFVHDTRALRLDSEPARLQQPVGQCHFSVVQAGSRERCPCQCYQHNRGAPGNVCDCNHPACFHAQNAPEERLSLRESVMGSGGAPSVLLERIRRLEEAVQVEREIRESVLARERQAWEREVKLLREALTPFYKSEQDMQRRLAELEDKTANTVNEQMHLKEKMASIDTASVSVEDRIRGLPTNGSLPDLRSECAQNGPHTTSRSYSDSEARTSASAEPMSPKQGNNHLAEPESPRSSGILNLVELPRLPVPRYTLPPRLSPPADVDVEEPRSSGFLALDVKEIIQRRKIANKNSAAAQAYASPHSSTAKSPPIVSIQEVTPHSMPQVSVSNVHIQNHISSHDDRAYKKRKHQTEIMALEVLADVSAASPVMS